MERLCTLEEGIVPGKGMPILFVGVAGTRTSEVTHYRALYE